MKKLILCFLLILSLNVIAGEVVNKSTGDRIIFKLDRSSNILGITQIKMSEESYKEITLNEFEVSVENGTQHVKTKRYLYTHCGPCGPAEGDPQVLFRLSDDIFYETKEMFNHVWVGYVIPVYNLAMISQNLIDVVFLPINITRKISRNKFVEKDIKLLNNLLNSNNTYEINTRQFKRLSLYF